MDVSFIELTPFVWAQVCGLIVLLICLVAPQFKTKSKIVVAHIAANAFALMQFYFLGQLAGVISAAIAVARGLLFIGFESRSTRRIPVWVLFLFIPAQFVCVFAFFEGWHSLLLLIPALYTYGQWQKDVKVTRITLLITSIAVGTYCVLVSAYMGALNELIQSTSICIAFWRYHSSRNDRTI